MVKALLRDIAERSFGYPATGRPSRQNHDRASSGGRRENGDAGGAEGLGGGGTIGGKAVSLVPGSRDTGTNYSLRTLVIMALANPLASSRSPWSGCPAALCASWAHGLCSTFFIRASMMESLT